MGKLTTWYLPARDRYQLRITENRVLRRICETKRERGSSRRKEKST
jgi:hypothetical protein